MYELQSQNFTAEICSEGCLFRLYKNCDVTEQLSSNKATRSSSEAIFLLLENKNAEYQTFNHKDINVFRVKTFNYYLVLPHDYADSDSYDNATIQLKTYSLKKRG